MQPKGEFVAEEKVETNTPIVGESVLSKGEEQWLNEHMDRLKKTIIKEARESVQADGRDEVEPADVSGATMIHAPGFAFPRSFWDRILGSITGVTLMSFLLAVFFGGIGVIIVWKQGNTAGAQGYFDIVKIFAGAVVGSTGAGIEASLRARARKS